MKAGFLYVMVAIAGIDTQSSIGSTPTDSGFLTALRELSPLALVLLFALLLVDRLPNVLAKWKAVYSGRSATEMAGLDADDLNHLKAHIDWWRTTGINRMDQLYHWHAQDLPGSKFPGEKTWHNLTLIETLSEQSKRLAQSTESIEKLLKRLERRPSS